MKLFTYTHIRHIIKKQFFFYIRSKGSCMNSHQVHYSMKDSYILSNYPPRLFSVGGHRMNNVFWCCRLFLISSLFLIYICLKSLKLKASTHVVFLPWMLGFLTIFFHFLNLNKKWKFFQFQTWKFFKEFTFFEKIGS